MKADLRLHYQITDPASERWDNLNELVWALPLESATMRALADLIREEDGETVMPEEGPQTMNQVWNIWNQKRGVRAVNEQPLETLRSGVVAGAPNRIATF